jgi:putative transposase
MSKKQTKEYDNEFKLKAVLELLKGEQTLNELSTRLNVLPHNLKYWKKQFLENATTTFNRDKGLKPYKDKLQEKDKQIDELYRQIGKINTELEWAKKKSKELGLDY